MPPKAMPDRPARSAWCSSPRGPGATNAVTGITDALMDSIPVVFLTGQVPTHLIGNDAFQEADTVGITRPCTKHNYLVKDTDRARPRIDPRGLPRRHAPAGPGPVVVDMPKDVQIGKAPYSRSAAGPRINLPPAGHEPDAARDRARRSSCSPAAKRPILYTGGGVINSGPERVPAAARTRPR